MINLVLRIAILPFMVLALTFHEFAHAWMAYKLGDDTARRAGRLSLNPLVHIDWLGLIMIVLVGFGWAKPVPVDPSKFRNPPLHMALVAVAGPISNLLLALMGVIVYRLSILSFPYLLPAVETFVWLNIILAVFNMIPLPPLDGWRVLQGFKPSLYWDYDLEHKLQYVLLGLILISILLPMFDILGMIIFPLSRLIYTFLLGLVGIF
ncbi:MAG: site-2 protease family protein [Thermotogae bacterium]|nr:site-2 protease family protein [Thermotogota bacterium]